MTINMPGKDVPVRLVSYLTTHPEKDEATYVLGVDQHQMLVLRHLAKAKDDTTMFFVDSTDSAGIRLYWAKDRAMLVVRGNVTQQCFVSKGSRMHNRESSIFVVQAAKADPWFNLIAWDRLLFAIDVAAGRTDDGNRVLLWDRNGGDNQIWRIDPVKT